MDFSFCGKGLGYGRWICDTSGVLARAFYLREFII
jgi:hypothetical protein